MPHADVVQLLLVLDTAYDRRSWHGPNLRGALRGVTRDLAAWRPKKGAHNIWELTVHAAYWKCGGLLRMGLAARSDFPFTGSNWFERPIEATRDAWRADLRLLEQMHKTLCEAVARMSARDLNRRAKGTPFTNREVVMGLAAHDLYHAGQIQLLKRLWKDSSVGPM